MKSRLVALVIWLGVGGCRVGTGAGAASGKLFVQDCKLTTDYGTLSDPAPFDLRPVFFVGEPIEDISSGQKSNRLIIRLERSGKLLELNDVLSFDIVQAYSVARCIRGKVTTAADGKTTANYDEKTCFWGPNGPRLRVGVDQPIRVNLVPRATCPPHTPEGVRNVIATAVSTEAAEGAWESWIEFEDFGLAAQPGVARAQRPDIDPNFKLDYGQRLHARAFKLLLNDDRVLKAIKRGDQPPEPEVGGALDGWFDFDLERGQGAQTFP